MKSFRIRIRATALITFASLQIALAGVASARETRPVPPSQIYGELFHRVQTERLFPDSKTFADATPKSEPTEIMSRYAANKGRADFSLREFIAENFVIPD